MFTIKFEFPGGQACHECASFRFRKPGVNIADTIADPDHPSIDMFDTDGKLLQSFTVTSKVYAMNAAGKTIATFDGSNPRQAGAHGDTP